MMVVKFVVKPVGWRGGVAVAAIRPYSQEADLAASHLSQHGHNIYLKLLFRVSATVSTL